MPTTITLTPTKGGSEVIIRNPHEWEWIADRPAAENGHLGMAGHRLPALQVKRPAVLPEGGKVQQDYEVCDLAAAQGDDAYFDGEIIYARPENPEQTVRLYRFHGHIETISEKFKSDAVIQTIEIAITKLDVGNAEFRRAHNA